MNMIHYKGKLLRPMAGGDGTLDVLEAVVNQLKQRGGMDLGGGAQYRATPSTPSQPYYTGPGGLFGVSGLERDLISARIQPMGLADRLPVLMSNMMEPLFAYLTGFQADSGSEPSGVCDDPPTVGAGKSCIQTAQFGRFSRQTRTLEVNRLGAQINRGEFTDLRFVNDPLLGGMGGLTVPGGVNAGGATPNLRQEATMRMIELGVSFQLWLSRMIFEGNPVNNTAGNGYREFPGLDILIGSNKVDALTNTACAALNSDIKDFNYLRIDTNANAMIQTMSYLMRYLRYNAEHMNFGDTQWALVMRPSLFWELTSVWPCAYATYRCQVSGTAYAEVDAMDMIRMRDDMRNGNYLMLDGIRYPVILDSNIREATNTTNNRVQSGAFASDIYVVPLTVRGGMPVTYWEAFDYRTSLGILDGAPMANQFFWSDSGRYLWHFKPPNNWCVQWLAKIEPRIILRTPQLAGRIRNVMYMPLQHERDVRTTDPYFVNGGVTSNRSMGTQWADWGSVSPPPT